MQTNVKLFRALAMSVLLLSVGIEAFAQNATGAIKGIVKDPNNAVVTTAVATATNKATGTVRKVNAGSDGIFVFESLQPGDYEVKVEAQGFSTQVQTLTVQVGGTTTADFSVTVGAASQTVDVTADAPVINTTDTVVGGIMGRDKVENLPLNGRSFLSIALLEPGVNVNYNSSSTAGAPNNFFQVSVGAAPQQMTLIMVDGSRVNDRITGGTSQNFSAETVQEFQISTIGFDLSTGTVSAGAVNIVSRTGTNTMHGSGFFFYRDHNMSAFTGFRRPTERAVPGGPTLSPFCADPTSAACQRVLDPFFVRRQYGGSIGGPIQKDKLFFFGNYERNDQVGAQSITFTDLTLIHFNHVAQQPSDGHLANVRLDYTVNQKHTAFFRAGLDANDGASGGNMESTWIASSNFAYQGQMGVTSVLRPTLVNDFRFSYSSFRNRLSPPSQELCEQIAGNPAFCFGLGGPRISFYGGLQIGTNINVSQDRNPRTYQFTDNVSWTKGSHRVRFGGNWEHQNAHGTWGQNVAGSYSGFSPTQVSALNPALFNALPASLKTGGTGATFADLLKLPVTGTLSIGIGDIGQPARPYRFEEVLANNLFRFYGQDGWQVRPGLTMNYGLGWSFETNTLYHDIDLPKYLEPIVGPGNIGKTISHRYKNFDPALGFAWAPGKEPKTVVRASLGLHHTSPNIGFFNLDQRILFGPAGNGLAQFSGSTLQNPLVATPCGSVAANPTLGCVSFSTPSAFSLQDMLNNLGGFRSSLAAGIPFKGTDLSVRGVQITKSVQGGQGLDAIYDNDSGRTPYTIHVDVGVQREIMRNFSVSADLVMRRGVGFGAFELFFPDLNRWNRFSGYAVSPTSGAAGVIGRRPVIPACTTTAQSRDPNANCSLGPIQYGLPGILSNYRALQIKVDKRFSKGFSVTGAYSLSRYYTIVSISSLDDLHQGHGISNNNPKHRLTFSGIWVLPKYNGNQQLLRGVVNGWQLSTIMQMQSAAPTSVTLGTLDIEGDGTFRFLLPGTKEGSFGYNIDADGIRKLVAQYNGTVAAPKDTPLVLIPAGAQRDAIGTALPFIVLPPNFSHGDSFMTHDIRLSRTVSIGEKVKLQLIGEGFNIFNIANLTGFSGSLDAYVRPTATRNATTGVVTVTAAGRNPTFNFGQPTNRVTSTFGSGPPRAFQIAARLSF